MYPKQLASEFGITVPELEMVMQGRRQWRSMVNNYDGMHSLDD